MLSINLIIIFIINFCVIVSNGKAEPQLNLPPISVPSTRPDIYPNSYTPRASPFSGDRYNSDNDRSQRYGPPYGSVSELEDDIPNDYRQGDNPDDRYRYNYSNRDRQNLYNYTGPNYPQSLISQDNYNQYNRQSDRRYPDRDRFTNNPSYPDRYNSDRQYPERFNNYNQPNNNNNNNFYDERNRYEQDRRYTEEMGKLRNFLQEYDQQGSTQCTNNVAAQWNFETNINELTQADALLAQQRYSDYQRSVYEQTKNIDKNLIFDQNFYRQLHLIEQVGPSALAPDQLDRYTRIINDMLVLYNGASICVYQQPFQCGLSLNPDLKQIMARSRDWDELQHTWTEFRRKTGNDMRDSYEQLVDLINEIAIVNNYTNGGDYWFSAYDSPNFREEIDTVWLQIQPLYELLHAYVRRKLREYYGPDRINRNAPIPAHILGNMYGQSWSNILDITIPYPGRNFIDVTPRMLEQGYTPLIMFQLAEEFFTSMNMSAMPQDFWINSIVEQPLDRATLCQPSAWDFCNRRDYRIKMCTRITQKDLVSVHHEMSHIQYFLNYRHQPKVFRDGANPGFHEAIGEAIGLSITTPKHLQTLGLIQKSVDDTAYDINYLFAMAADKVAFLPFALSLEAWRYDIFSRRTNKEMMNCRYWDLREQYGGIKPPVLRSEMDFDPGAKYHVPANVPYLKYFVGTILQFQIYRAMCRISRQYDPSDPQKPLHKCDVYRQPEAGNLLRRLMEKGASQPWQQQLEEVIGEGRLDGSALRDYFRPLEEWLRNENLRNQEFVGWTYDGDYCKRSIETANLQVFGGFYNNVQRINAFGFYGIVVISLIVKSLI